MKMINKSPAIPPKNHAILWCLLLSLMNVSAISQEKLSITQCIEDMDFYYKKMKTTFEPTDETAMNVNYTVTSIPHKSEGAVPYISKVDFTFDEEKQIMKSKEVNIYNDGKQTFTIVDLKKMIYISNSKGENNHLEDRLGIFRDSLFSTRHIENCEHVCTKDVENISYALELNETGKELFGITNINYEISKKSDQLVSASISYTKLNKVKELQITFNKVQTVTVSDFSKAATQFQVLKSDGSLIERYKDYKLINLTKEK